MQSNHVFDQGIRVLRAYRQDNGDTRVKVWYKDPSGFHLYNWLRTQRQLMRKGKLSRSKIRRLNNAGVYGLVLDQMYADHIALLLKAKTIVGTVNVRADYVLDGVKLGQWLAQAKHRTIRDGVVPEKWVKELEAIGVEFSKSVALPNNRRPRVSHPQKTNIQAFSKGLKLLEEFRREFGHVRVLQDKGIYKDFNLGSWLHLHRRNWRAGTLSLDRIEALAKLGVEKRH